MENKPASLLIRPLGEALAGFLHLGVVNSSDGHNKPFCT